MFFTTLTPKFYVALTGTSSLISGLILIFEWWYFKRYGTSFIEHISLSSLSPFFGTGGDDGDTDSQDSNTPQSNLQDCKVWRNPYSLFRGAEYHRLYCSTGKEPLTYYDMNLSAQDHQTIFTCEADAGKAEYEIMQLAWRERNPRERIKKAKEALAKSPECTTAMILLAEEDTNSIVEAEQMYRQAYKICETTFRRSACVQHPSPQQEALHRRDTHVLIFVRRRLAMCARKMNKLKDAIKMMKDLLKEFPTINIFNIHENLIECYLAAQQYADAQAVLAKYDDMHCPKSATICYTAALLKARHVADKFSPDVAARRGLNSAEIAAVDTIHRAVEFNPHVPKYLLELKPLILPPEHILKRGDSEAIPYAFFHLEHWHNVQGALSLLQYTWKGTFRLIPYPLEKGNLFFPYPDCTENADRELLPAYHSISVYPKKDIPFFILFTGGLCTITALLAILTHRYPDQMAVLTRQMLAWLWSPLIWFYEKAESIVSYWTSGSCKKL